MPVTHRYRRPPEVHFTEGEPDLEAPEELAVEELGEDAQLEEELDNEDLLEEDVDEDVIAVTLEDLVHGDDPDEEGDQVGAAPHPMGADREPVTASDDDDEPGDDADDLEEALDLVLAERLALPRFADVDTGGQGETEEVAAGGPLLVLTRAELDDTSDVAPCGPDEFVCRGCFLVRKRVQLIDPHARLCRDCSS